MPRRCRAAVVAALLGPVVVLAGCSGGDDGADTGSAATPTAVGDRPLVEVLDAGADDRRVLAFDPAPDSSSEATIEVAQRVSRDQEPTVVPPVSIPFTSKVTGVDRADGDSDATLTTTQTYDRPTVDATGSSSSAVRDVEQALSSLAGTTSTLVVRPDGTTVEAASGVPAADSVDAQVRELVAVLPSEAVGIGARWTATSVDQVDGAVVDQVATYALTALDGDAYEIEVTIDQTYRPGQVEEVEVSSGRGTLTATLTGSLDRLLPDTARGNVASQVSYVVGGQLTEVRTTATLGLEAGVS
ncbi:hypothetical protein [Nocardioides plantarum]|uniref:GerMN domain-containing protein n=1 Tax=Nocardioides plantarum TaxID=29299 RepID=A0ABV5K8F0_9ACTN|nr:hypothetical protein [Nocardioides plantarum]